MPGIPELPALELKALPDRGSAPVLVDVRQPGEHVDPP
jgi:hypothetical protein